MAWKRGPLPPGTYNWGGVIPAGEVEGTRFYLCGFLSDRAVIPAQPGNPVERTLKAHEVAWYDNGIGLPPISARPVYAELPEAAACS